MEKFPLNIEIREGEHFVKIIDLIAMVEGSMSGRGQPSDLILFNIASQLKGIRLEALKPTEENHAS